MLLLIKYMQGDADTINPYSNHGSVSVLSFQKDVYILNGLGGNGMTVTFGLTEEMVSVIKIKQIKN